MLSLAKMRRAGVISSSLPCLRVPAYVSGMLRYDLMTLIAGAIRRNLTTINEDQALDMAEDVLDEIESAGLRIEKLSPGERGPKRPA